MELSGPIRHETGARRRQHHMRWDLVFAILLTVAGMVVALLGMEGLPRLLLGLLLSLVLPGYGLVAAFFPPRSIESLVRLMLVPGLSLGLGVLGGMVLYLLPWGLWPGTWAIYMGGIALVGSLVGLVRHYRQPRRHLRRADPALAARRLLAGPSRRRSRWAFGPLPGTPAAPARPAAPRRIQWLNWAVLVLSALIVAAAMAVARDGWNRYNTTAFTQFWALPERVDGALTLRLGIRNEEGQPITYRLLITAANVEVREWPPIELEPGQRWESVIPMPEPGVEPLQVLLYRQDQPATFYRRAEIWPKVLKEQ